MSRIPFKRQLIILASIIAALSFAIPVATFAHAQGNPPPGEQKRIQPAVRVQAVAGQPTAITADCSAPQTLVTLNKGDVFNASATLTTTDPDEESEGETLQILDASTTPPTVLLNLDLNTGSATIKPFTASVNNDPIQACIVGHSLGGVIAFGYMALLEDHVNGMTLPSGAKLRAVVTLDSPLGGVPGNIYSFFSKIVAETPLGLPGYPCSGLNSQSKLHMLDDMVKINQASINGGTTPPSDSGKDPLGAVASVFAIAGVTNPQPTLPFLPSNDLVAGAAHTDLGTDILTIGNTHDFLWNPGAPTCAIAYAQLPGFGLTLSLMASLIPDFNDTQFLEDQGDNSGHYGRAFTTPNTCAQSLLNTFNHLDVLSAANVLIGLKHFFSPVGQTPTPLKVNPFQS
jgi:pimeloyl-ACP methyl ester carboxylesterase